MSKLEKKPKNGFREEDTKYKTKFLQKISKKDGGGKNSIEAGIELEISPNSIMELV